MCVAILNFVEKVCRRPDDRSEQYVENVFDT